MIAMPSTIPPYIPKSLPHAAPSPRHCIFLDTNIMNYLIKGKNGEVIDELRENLLKRKLIESTEVPFCMTPFQLMEALGIKPKDANVVATYSRGETANDVVTRVMKETFEYYLALPELSQKSLEARAQEMRAHLKYTECLELYDGCVLERTQQAGLGPEIAMALALDNAQKATYPKSIAADVELVLYDLLIVKGYDTYSRFRVAKRMWDKIYSRTLKKYRVAPPKTKCLNKAMHLKSRRDFLDCDLIHLACFGLDGEDVLAITCDPPETIKGRMSVYKCLVAAVSTDIDSDELPKIRNGIIAISDTTGVITHVFRAQDVPAIG